MKKMKKGTIEKYGEINADGKLEWTITAEIPGYNGKTYQTWAIYDAIFRGPALELYKGKITIAYGTQIVTLNFS